MSRLSASSRTALRRRAARRAAETRALYAYEGAQLRDPHLLKIRTMPQLRRLARRLWEDQKTARPDAVPQILAGRGAYQSGRWLSYCEGRRKIVLARHERNLRTLIHELTHAIGFGTHGAGFRQRYFALLARYGGPLNAATRKALAVEVKRLAA